MLMLLQNYPKIVCKKIERTKFLVKILLSCIRFTGEVTSYRKIITEMREFSNTKVGSATFILLFLRSYVNLLSFLKNFMWLQQ